MVEEQEKPFPNGSTPSTQSHTSDTDSIHETQSIRQNDQDNHPNRLHLVRSYASGYSGFAPQTEYADINLKHTTTGATLGSTTTANDPAFEVDWEDNDPENPRNWSMAYKSFVVFAMSYSTTVTVLFSTSYTVTIASLERVFDVGHLTALLGLTTYLIGMAAGSTVLAPLSEMYGRRPVYIFSTAIFVLLILPCALAKNIESLLIPRFFGAFAAASLVSNAPGSINDIVVEEYRALAFSIWAIGPLNGPVVGPIIGGFTYQYLGWRWTNWLVMILAGVAFAFVAIVKETYGPTLLRKRAAKKRKETGDPRWWSRFDEKKAFLPLLKVNLSRPFVLMVTEPICIFWDVYVAIVYGTLYLSFVAYPIVFQQQRGWSPGLGGLAFCGIGIGNLLTILLEPACRRLINSHRKDPETGDIPPEAMVSVICIAAVSLAAGELWFAWTCTPNTHWIVPILAGVPFGAGNAGVFIYSNNYLVHSYSVYAASALAGNAVLRSIMGAVLPLAGPAMYASLGSNWAGCTLGLIEMACVPIPVVFYLYGKKIRAKSSLIKQLQEDKRRADEKKERFLRKMEREAIKRGDAEASVGGVAKTGAAVAEERDVEKGA
ncbi:MFS general substrate transporter [Aureobasidium pullulans]|uniref:Cercosporin MFS transporter CTB4 n=1 Tax=Aureobasidium pullulans TaxID=5580 RepID=A0A4S8YQU2_AURPU|nr:MFS general substrate transporter [Aureobasidium pullulans]